MSISVSAVVLAAGESSRMGRQKALLEWHGMPLIAYQLEQLANVQVVRETIVVTGHNPDEITAIAAHHPRTTIVHNPNYRSGKVSSILAGLRAVGDADAILVLAVDQPRTAPVLAQIVDAHAASECALTVPTHRGRRGHPLVFAVALRPELESINEETQGLRAVVAAHADGVCEVECDASVLLDMNRPADIPQR